MGLPMLVNALRAEAIKLKGTLALAFAVVVPLLMVVTVVLDNPGEPGALFFGWVYNVWFVLVFALHVALLTALLFAAEHQNGQWRHLFALPLPRAATYLAKSIVAFLLVALSQAVLFLGSLAAVWLLGDPTGLDLGFELRVLLATTVGAALMVAIQAWLSFRFRSFLVPLAVGFGGTIVNAFAFSNALVQKAWPWVYPVAIDLALEADHPFYAGWSVPFQLAVSVVGALVVTALALVEVGRRDVS